MMKTVALTLCILAQTMGSASWVMADDLAMAETPPNITHTIFGGVVKFVSWADPVKGTKSEIIVKDAGGKATNILVTPTTTLWDAEAKAIMPDRIVVRSHVNVIYLTTPEGVNEGKSIKILK